MLSNYGSCHSLLSNSSAPVTSEGHRPPGPHVILPPLPPLPLATTLQQQNRAPPSPSTSNRATAPGGSSNGVGSLKAPLVVSSCARRHLVMPSLRSLVPSASSSSPSPPGSSTSPPPSSAPRFFSMGASSSSSSSSAHADSPPGSPEDQLPPQQQSQPCSRLIAPRPSLLPALSPKRPMKRDASCGSLLLGLRPSLGGAGRGSSSSSSSAAIRKCETVLALSSMEPLKPVNRLRMGSSKGLVCSRCSSLMSMPASASRASLNTVLEAQPPQLLCKLCLCEVPLSATSTIQQCQCSYCTDCLRQYVTLEVTEAAYEISCPDAQCDLQGVLSLAEIEQLITPELMEKHTKFRINREVDLDKERVWCPRAGCETACRVCPGCLPQAVHCPTCEESFCSTCKQPWHQGKPCADDKNSSKPIFDPERIKLCPMCGVPIEKDEGCAQMMCKRCKHVFCWYCLASLDDDFLLRHYDKGPCKNKLGHSRASVIWHRTQVIAIFAGFGVLLLVASPLLLLAAPCIVCCKCRSCQEKLDEDEGSSAGNVMNPSPNS